MTQKNLKPQQAAPVQREINTTASEGGTGHITPAFGMFGKNADMMNPFAGDDAE